MTKFIIQNIYFVLLGGIKVLFILNYWE